jgi:glycosyltransferase involved in cell wall biosynthesis
MKILAQTPKYLPDQWSGGETMLHDYLKLLVDEGHEVWVIADNPSVTEYEGVNLFDRSMVEVLYKGCDLVITHLGSIGMAVNKCRKYQKPLIYIVHNDYEQSAVRTHSWINVVYNSEWCAKKLPYKGKSVICRPIINYDRFKDLKPKGEFITMVNINENKGGKILQKIAEALPQYTFQAILGGYQQQILPQPDNVIVRPHGLDMAKIYESSKMVIVPSKYESWGRVAAEAIVSGLLVIHSDTLGLKEVGGHKTYTITDRNDVNDWAEVITDFMEYDNCYNDRIEHILQRKTELLQQAEEDKRKFCTFVKTIYNDKDDKSTRPQAF